MKAKEVAKEEAFDEEVSDLDQDELFDGLTSTEEL